MNCVLMGFFPLLFFPLFLQASLHFVSKQRRPISQIVSFIAYEIRWCKGPLQAWSIEKGSQVCNLKRLGLGWGKAPSSVGSQRLLPGGLQMFRFSPLAWCSPREMLIWSSAQRKLACVYTITLQRPLSGSAFWNPEVYRESKMAS